MSRRNTSRSRSTSVSQTSSMEVSKCSFYDGELEGDPESSKEMFPERPEGGATARDVNPGRVEMTENTSRRTFCNDEAVVEYRGGVLQVGQEEEEEEEDLLDERRRNEELKNLVTNAFADIEDDDQSFTSEGSEEESEGGVEKASNYVTFPPGQKNLPQSSSHPRALTPSSGHSSKGKGLVQEASEDSSETERELRVRMAVSEGDSSSGSHYDRCQKTSPVLGYQGATVRYVNRSREPEVPSQEGLAPAELEVLYDARGRELERTKQEMNQIRQELEEQVLAWRQRAACMEDERSSLTVSLQQAKALVAAEKGISAEMRGNLQTYRAKLMCLEEGKADAIKQLQASEMTVGNLQQQLIDLEKNESLRKIREHHDKVVKSIQERHDLETRSLQEQYEELRTSVATKNKQIIHLESQMEQLRKTLQHARLESGEAINRLTRSLAESQEQCQKLLSSELGNENVKLQAQLHMLRREKQKLEEQINSLQAEAHHRSEAARCEAMQNLDLRPSSLEAENASRESAVRITGSQLHQELRRSLESQRDEINSLRRELRMKEDVLKAYEVKHREIREEMEQWQVELLKYTQESQDSHPSAEEQMENKRLDIKLVQYQMELEAVRKEMDDMHQVIATLVQQASTMTAEAVENTKTACLNMHEHVLKKVQEEKIQKYEEGILQLRRETEAVNRELDRVQELYVKVCGEKDGLEVVSQSLKEDLEDLTKRVKGEEEIVAKAREEWLEKEGHVVRDLTLAKTALQIQVAAMNKNMESQVAEKLQEEKRTWIEHRAMHVKEHLQEAEEKLKAEYEAKVEEAVVKARTDVILQERSRDEGDGAGKHLVEALKKTIGALKKEHDKVMGDLRVLEYRYKEQHDAQQETVQTGRDMELAAIEEQQQLSMMKEELARGFKIELESIVKRKDEELDVFKQVIEAEKLDIIRAFENKIEEHQKNCRPKDVQCVSAAVSVSEEELGIACQRQYFERQLKDMEERKEEEMRLLLEKHDRETEEHSNIVADLRQRQAEMETAYQKDIQSCIAVMKATNAREEEIGVLQEQNAKILELMSSLSSLTVESGLQCHEAGSSEADLNPLSTARNEGVCEHWPEVRSLIEKWASEVHMLRQARSVDEKKIEEIRMKHRQLKEKLKNYKKYIQDKEIGYKDNYEKLEMAYSRALLKMQSCADKFWQEKESEGAFKNIASEYSNQPGARHGSSTWQTPPPASEGGDVELAIQKLERRYQQSLSEMRRDFQKYLKSLADNYSMRPCVTISVTSDVDNQSLERDF